MTPSSGHDMISDLGLEAWEVRAQDYPGQASLEARVAFLLRYAVLAPSSHNTQPWRFEVDGTTVCVFADPSGWLDVADPDRREWYLSVGCAIENLLIAARRFGFHPVLSYGGGGDEPEARIELRGTGDGCPLPGMDVELFEAITVRHTNHGRYDGRVVPAPIRARLQRVAGGRDIQVHLTDDPDVRARVDELTVRADVTQFADPAWRRELGSWLRRGVFGQGRIMSRVVGVAVSRLDFGTRTGRKDRELLGSASLLGVVTGPDRDRVTALEAGRVFQRTCLRATAEGLVLQPMNQVLQVEEVRAELERLLPADWGRPLLTFRLGYADAEAHTPRAPAKAVTRPR